MMKGEGKRGVKKQRPIPLELLYAKATNAAKQKNKQGQVKSPDRSVIILSHDKTRTIELPQRAVLRSILVTKSITCLGNTVG